MFGTCTPFNCGPMNCGTFCPPFTTNSWNWNTPSSGYNTPWNCSVPFSGFNTPWNCSPISSYNCTPWNCSPMNSWMPGCNTTTPWNMTNSWSTPWNYSSQFNSPFSSWNTTPNYGYSPINCGPFGCNPWDCCSIPGSTGFGFNNLWNCSPWMNSSFGSPIWNSIPFGGISPFASTPFVAGYPCTPFNYNTIPTNVPGTTVNTNIKGGTPVQSTFGQPVGFPGINPGIFNCPPYGWNPYIAGFPFPQNFGWTVPGSYPFPGVNGYTGQQVPAGFAGVCRDAA